MIRTWPGQTKEEWFEEYWRDKALTKEEKDRERDEYIKAVNEKWDKIHADDENKKQLKNNAKEVFKNYDHPNSLENNEATILWFIVMAVGAIFNDRLIIWIIATIIWLSFIMRHHKK